MPPYQTIMNSNTSFQVQARRVTKKASAEITKQLQKEFEDVFTGIGCFDRMFSLQVKQDRNQVPPRCIAYAL